MKSEPQNRGPLELRDRRTVEPQNGELLSLARVAVAALLPEESKLQELEIGRNLCGMAGK